MKVDGDTFGHYYAQCVTGMFIELTLSLLMTTQIAFSDSVDQDQTARSVQSDL